MDDKKFINDYLTRYKNSLFENDMTRDLIKLKEELISVKAQGKKVLVAGNGASAAIASHIAVDFTKQAGVRTVNFNEADLITCLANDYGYENWVSKAIEFYIDPGDLVILISSSGTSQNIVNAAEYAKSNDYKLVTFTGFYDNNALKQFGDLNFWVDSRAYNIIENTHQIWLLMVCDMIVGQIEYPA